VHDKRVCSHWNIWITLHTHHDLHTGYIAEVEGRGKAAEVGFFAAPVDYTTDFLYLLLEGQAVAGCVRADFRRCVSPV